MKRLLLLATCFAGSVLAQQADISGAQLLSGEADSRLQQVARDAAAAGKKLVINAPEFWHEMILEQVRKGGGDNVQVELRDSFAESVLVRAEGDAPAPAAASAPTPAPAPTATPAPAAVATPPVQPTPAPRPATPAPRPAPQPVTSPTPPTRPAPQPAINTPQASSVERATVPATQAPATPSPAPTPRVEAPAVTPAAPLAPAPAASSTVPANSSPAPAPTPTPTAAPATAANAPAASESGASAQAQRAALRRRIERNLNGGEPIARSLTQTELEVGDVLYAQGDVVAVLRRTSLRNQVYWLEGGIELRRIELKELARNRYQVAERIRNPDSPRLRAVRIAGQDEFVAEAPSKHAAERQRLERLYNGGNAINSTLSPQQVRQKDLLYVGDELAVVVRVNGLDLERYWLVGTINLARTELIKDGANRYRVLSDIRD